MPSLSLSFVAYTLSHSLSYTYTSYPLSLSLSTYTRFLLQICRRNFKGRWGGWVWVWGDRVYWTVSYYGGWGVAVVGDVVVVVAAVGVWGGDCIECVWILNGKKAWISRSVGRWTVSLVSHCFVLLVWQETIIKYQNGFRIERFKCNFPQRLKGF